MRLHHAIFFVLSIFFVSAAQASDVSWMFRPGYYTHSPVTGQRVAQYEPERPSIVPTDPTYQESGYRHQLIQAGNDRLEHRADLGRGHGDPALRRVGVSVSGRGDALRPLGQSARPLDAALRCLAESLRSEPPALRLWPAVFRLSAWRRGLAGRSADARHSRTTAAARRRLCPARARTDGAERAGTVGWDQIRAPVERSASAGPP